MSTVKEKQKKVAFLRKRTTACFHFTEDILAFALPFYAEMNFRFFSGISSSSIRQSLAAAH